jgi:hypothetical protein
LVLSVTLLQRSVAVEIDSALVTSLNRSRPARNNSEGIPKVLRVQPEA